MTAHGIPKLLAFDLDGTLLPSSKKITARTREVLDAMIDLGAQITLATGKFHHLTLGHGDELELDTPLISLDGARIGNRAHPERRHGVPAEIAREMLDRYRDSSDHVFADSGEDVMLLCSPDVEYFRHVTRFWADDYRQVDDVASHLAGDPAILTFYGAEEPMRALATEMRQSHPTLRVTEYASNLVARYRVSIQPGGIHKGTGVIEIADALGIEVGEVMVFGDWLNDLPMFEIGAIGVAMANAVTEVLEAADHVTRSTCEEDGIAEFLERNFL